MKNAIAAAAIFTLTPVAQAQDFQKVYNTLSAQANVAMKISACHATKDAIICETQGTRLSANIIQAKLVRGVQLGLVAMSPDMPNAGDLYALAGAYGILVLLTDQKLKGDAIPLMVSEMTKQAAETKKEVVLKANGHTYSLNIANLALLGFGKGYLLTYTAR